MGFSFGSFAGGVADGADNGLDMSDKLRKLYDAARVRSAQRALGTTYASDAPMSDGSPTPPVTPPEPGVASSPAGAPDPLAALGQGSGAPPPPSAAPAPMIAGPGTPGPTVAPGGPAVVPPATSSPAPAPPEPATGTGGAPLSGVAASSAPPGQGASPEVQLTSTITDANNTIKAIAHAVKQANPNIDPETLFEATRQHIEQMKGVRNEVKDYMTAQAEYAKAQWRIQNTITKAATALSVADTRADAQRDVAQTNATSRENVGAGHDTARVTSAGIAGQARTDAAGITAGGGVTRAQIAADASRYAADTRYKGLVYDKTIGAYVKINDSVNAANAKVDAATANAGGTPPDRHLVPLGDATPPKKTYLDGQGNPVAPKRAAGGYKTPADVKAAYAAGKIDRATAAGVLKTQFGMQ